MLNDIDLRFEQPIRICFFIVDMGPKLPLGRGGRVSVADYLPDQIKVFIGKPSKK